MKYLTVLIFALLLFSCHTLFSQNSKKAKANYDKGLSYYFDFKPDKAHKKFIEAIEVELATENPDLDFICECFEFAAGTKSQMEEYNEAISLTKHSLPYARKSGNRENVNNAIIYLADYYSWFQLYNQPLESTCQPGKPKWVNFNIDQVYKIKDDTLWVLIEGGINHGIIKGDTGSAFSTYSSEYPNRGNLHLGYANLIESDFNVSTCYVVLKNTTDPSLRVKEGDLIELQCILPGGNEDFIFTRLAQLNIIFNDFNGEPIIDQMEMLGNTDFILEDDILHFMTDDIHSTLEYLQDNFEDNSRFSEALFGGKYSSNNLIDALKRTRKTEVKAFLNHLISNPSEYKGKRLKFNVTYVTWFINTKYKNEFDNYRNTDTSGFNKNDLIDYLVKIMNQKN